MIPIPVKFFIKTAMSCFIFFLWINNGFGQYFITGTDPASIKWEMIKTPHFKIIYPLTFEKHAQYIANAMEYVRLPVSGDVKLKIPRWPVIIHNQTTIPSSVTYLAPRRMDFFTAPPQDIYPQDWVDQLIIHEFRHAVQYSSINSGFTKVLSGILGEQGAFVVYGLFMPIWFIEGDATVAETAFHNTGRGRTPSFEMRLRAQFVEKGIYSYGKGNYGSFADFVPNKYELGYQLIGNSGIYFKSPISNQIFKDVGRQPYTMMPFTIALKKQTGLYKYAFYDSMTQVLQKRWKSKDQLIRENEYQVLTNPSKKLYTNYNLPVVFRDSLIIAVKSNMDEITNVVLINQNKKEEKLFDVGVNYISESLSASDSLIYWSEMTNDPRWSMRDYRVIKTYNFNSGKIRQLTNRTRLYAPAVTKDGKYMAAVEVTPENEYYLVILNADDGSLIKKINTPENLLYIHPRWADDGKSIVSVVVGKNGNALAIIDPETGKTERLTDYTFMEIKRPSFWKNYIIYTASYNGTDNIYSYDRNSQEVFRVTSARFGASDATISNDQTEIYYSNYTSDGYQIVKEKLDITKWEKITIPSESAFPVAEKITKAANFVFNPDSVPGITYKSKPYSKALNLFNIHSWAPLGIDVQNFTATPGITLMSQNLLGTAVTMMGYQYIRNQKNGKYFFTMANESLYPAFDLGFDYGGRQDKVMNSQNQEIQEKWNELNLSAGVRLPLKWTHNIWTRSFQPVAGLNFKNLRMDESVPMTFEHNQILDIKYSILASNIIKTSYRDLFPRWGQKLQLNYNHTPFIKDANSIFAGQVTLNFPGFARHHSLQLYAGYQKKFESLYTYSDYIIFPRGYQEIFRNEIFSYSASYALPLFYPDFQIKNLFYFKRVKATFFYDFAKSTDRNMPKNFSSIGLDLTSDFSFINLIYPVDAGLRSIYNPETGEMKFEFLFSLNLGGMY